MQPNKLAITVFVLALITLFSFGFATGEQNIPEIREISTADEHFFVFEKYKWHMDGNRKSETTFMQIKQGILAEATAWFNEGQQQSKAFI